MKNNQSIHIDRSVGRGGILYMKPKDLDLVEQVIGVANEIDFTFIPLEQLIERDEERLPFAEIEGADAIQKNLDYHDVDVFIHKQEQTDQREVALTFDDWASEKVVLEVLDILDEYDIKSTFYIKTQLVNKNPNLARLLIEKGHEVANHSHSHRDSNTVSAEDLQEDLYKAHQILTEAIQEQPKLYFRPPFGRLNDEQAKVVSAMGFEVIGSYNLSSYDWNDEYTEEDVINRVMTNLEPGSVIVMHILDDIHTPSVLPDLIEAIQSEGYEFRLTSEWIESF